MRTTLTPDHRKRFALLLFAAMGVTFVLTALFDALAPRRMGPPRAPRATDRTADAARPRARDQGTPCAGPLQAPRRPDRRGAGPALNRRESRAGPGCGPREPFTQRELGRRAPGRACTAP